MRLIVALFLVAWLPGRAAAEPVHECYCTCDNLPVSCEAAYESGECLTRCGGASSPQPIYWPRASEETIRRQQAAQAYQEAVFWAERVDIDADIAARQALRAERRQARRAEHTVDPYVAYVQPAPEPAPPEPMVTPEPPASEPASGVSEACIAAMERIEHTQASFAGTAEKYGTDVARDQVQAAAEKIAQAEQSPDAWDDAVETFEKLIDLIEALAADAAAWLSCHRTTGCDLKALEERSREEFKALLAEHDGDLAESAERVEKASQFLEDYGRRLTEAQFANAHDVAGCGANTP